VAKIGCLSTTFILKKVSSHSIHELLSEKLKSNLEILRVEHLQLQPEVTAISWIIEFFSPNQRRVFDRREPSEAIHSVDSVRDLLCYFPNFGMTVLPFAKVE
jgi:hypothetical protein